MTQLGATRATVQIGKSWSVGVSVVGANRENA